MFERTVSLFSAGKTFSCTGFRVGYAIGPAPLVQPILSAHAAMNFCCPTPLQMALAHAFKQARLGTYFDWISSMMQEKRDGLVEVLKQCELRPVIPDGGYFVVADATRMYESAGMTIDEDIPPDTPLDQRPDYQICKWMTEHVGVTMIPVSPFFNPPDRHLANHMVRLAFCKDQPTLELATQRLLDHFSQVRKVT